MLANDTLKKYLLYLLLIFAILAIVAVTAFLLFSPAIRRSTRIAAAKHTLNVMIIALEKYREDFGSYPPDDSPSRNGSTNLLPYLGTRLNGPVKSFGPYLEFKSLIRTGPDGLKKIISPLGGDYFYFLKNDQYLLMDPGVDQELGGEYTDEKGFTPDNKDINGDKKPDYDDNIYTQGDTHKAK